MSKIYRNQSSGITVVSGKIKSIAEDRMVMVVTTDDYDRTAKKNNPVDLTISSGVPFEEEFKAGYSVTAAGYQHGKGVIAAEAVFTGNDSYETQDLAVVTGLVKFARMNEEKNADGSAKMKQDGTTPRKPHYDVTITVKEGDKWVDHVIKIYEGNIEEGKKSQMEKAEALFKNFDKETNRIRATFVTTPGQAYHYTVNKDGKEYVNYGCSHMGYKSLDVEFLDTKEKTQGTPAVEKPQTQNAQPAQEPMQQTPVQSGAGFDQDLSIDEDEMFK